MAQAQLSFSWCRGLQEIASADWQRLAGNHPLLDYRFLQAFEQTACVDAQTGWTPYHLVAFDQGQLVAAMPCYLKTHSYGEYVFDWSWADAYEQAGGQYYPKLISAIPFSPVTGPRLLLAPELEMPDMVAAAMLSQLQAFCEAHTLSGVHVLFPDARSASFCGQHGWLRREGVQFRWENAGYADWEAFMAALSRDKRKKIRQERQKVAQQGVTCRVVRGQDMTAQDLALFYQCYCHTYYRHRSSPYLTLAFFEQLQQCLPQCLQLFIASQQGEAIAASLCIRGEETLYGRYWGSLRDISCLHFELCYYQPQQLCIREHIRYFEGGAQGEHKLARGFEPYPTCSYHWLSHPDFHQSVARFLNREAEGMQQYVNELEERSPYKAMAEAPASLP
jgi:predicted N-acyltransferase